MMYLTIASLIILGGFIVISVRLFGLQKSYSSYAARWKEKYPIKNMNLWSIVTIVVAFLQLIPMITSLEGSMIQFVAFLVPCYLVAVALTPNYQEDRRQKIWHYIFTALCASGFIVYVAAGLHLWWLTPAVIAYFFFFYAFPSRTIITSAVLWLECALFATAHIVELIPGS